MEKEAEQEQVLTGRRRIGNNVVGGQTAGKAGSTDQAPTALTPRIITVTIHRAVAGKHIFETLLVAATSDCDGVIVNLADVPLLETAGLGALLDCQRRTTGRGAVFAIAEAPAAVRRQIEIVHLHKVLRCYRTNEAAREVVEMRSLERQQRDAGREPTNPKLSNPEESKVSPER